jgi:hypothetical protein
MPHITVWCLPSGLLESTMIELHNKIVAAVVGVKELGIPDETYMLNTFPPDMMQYGLGTEIMVHVAELWDKPERTPEVRQRLAEALGKAVKSIFPEAVVAVRLDPPFKPSDGFWTSKDSSS